VNIIRSSYYIHTELWRPIDFPRWRPYRRKYTSVLSFGYISRFWRYKAICVSNFHHISQSMFGRDTTTSDSSKQTVARLKFYFRFYVDLSPSSPCDLTLVYQILSNLDDRRRSYDVISILQHGGNSIANLVPVTGLI